MSDERKPTHQWIAFRDGEQVMCWPDDAQSTTEFVLQMMRDRGHMVIRQKIQEMASA